MKNKKIKKLHNLKIVLDHVKLIINKMQNKNIRKELF